MKIKGLFSVLLLWLLAATAGAETQSRLTFYHTDLNGTVLATTDETGNLKWRRSHAPYGEPLTQDTHPETVAYTGHVQDKSTGLVYMQARYYDPRTGRFLSQDPVGFVDSNPMSFNRYAYANNNPYRYVDPDGKIPIPAIIIGGIKLLDVAITAYSAATAVSNVARGEQTAREAAVEAAPGVVLGLAGLGSAKLAGGLIDDVAKKTVGRHMSPDELAKMKKTGRVQEGGGGQTRVADPANPNTYRNPPEGDVYVEFDVPADRVLRHSNGTGRIPGPNSPDARVPGRNAADFEMPPATNIRVP